MFTIDATAFKAAQDRDYSAPEFRFYPWRSLADVPKRTRESKHFKERYFSVPDPDENYGYEITDFNQFPKRKRVTSRDYYED